MISQQVNVQHMREVGEGWAKAIGTKRFDRIARFCQPDVHSRLLWTNHYATLESADALVSHLRQWFEESDPIQIQNVRIEPVGDKVAISYRLVLREREEWFEVERQIFGMLKDGLLNQLDLLCSGFRPTSASARPAGHVRVSLALRSSLPAADATLVASDEAEGSTCAILTPSIKAKLRELDSGQVLKVEVLDSTARDDIEAWSRLSGNELLTMSEEENGKMSLFLRKK